MGDANERTFDLAAVETRLRLEAGDRTWVVDRERPVFTFGRDRDNDLAVDDRLASRHHGSIAYHDGRFHLTDDSRNGTLVAFTAGATHLVHKEPVLLHGRGTVRLGHHDGQGFAFAVEIRSGEGRPWQTCPEASDNEFRREGDFWTLRYEGRVLRLKDARGLRYLAHLLRHPAQEFHVLDLALVGLDGAAAGDGPDSPRMAGGAGPLLDARAKADYRRRLSELRDELQEAERFNDVGRAARTRDEMEAVAGALAEAVGLGGRDREAASDAERGRVAVTRRIKDAVARIAQSDPALGEYFASSVHTGRFCSYRPGAARPVTWRF